MNSSLRGMRPPPGAPPPGQQQQLQSPQVHPPPYRAPPTPGNQRGAYSKFNVSEPNIGGGYMGSPVGYRHTINHENSQQMQHGLKNLLTTPKHQTLDNNGQNFALQHLRNNGFNGYPNASNANQASGKGDTYVSPDNLRDAANRIFTRNQNDRSSFGISSQNMPNPMASPNTSQPLPLPSHHQNNNPSSHQLNQFNTNDYSKSVRDMLSNRYPNRQQPQQQQFQHNMKQNVQQSPLSSDDPKRNSFTNQSFRKATGQQQQPGQFSPEMQQSTGKIPPQVPPKPQSRSTSRERLKEDVDNLDEELKNILRNGQISGVRMSMGGSTPPLPALSPGPGANAGAQQNRSQHNSPESSPQMRNKYKLNHSSTNLNRPDLLESENRIRNNSSNNQQQSRFGHQTTSGNIVSDNKVNSIRRATSINTENAHLKNDSNSRFTSAVQNRNTNPQNSNNQPHNHHNQHHHTMEHEMNSVTTGLDLESVMGLQTDLTSDDEISTTIDMTDAQAIRKQLDGLEGMYSEVLKLLGLRKYGRPSGNNTMDGKGINGRRKMYGSMSSLPSVSSIGSRHIYNNKEKRKDDMRMKRTSKDKSYNKRFQRLESHVVTLARSVAHLSSEMRSQQVMGQEIENLRQEVQQLRMMRQSAPNLQQGYVDPENFFPAQTPRISAQQANRVKKLTKFFGDEPPLLRLFLKNLGYEKYAAVFEEAKIGMLELPYLSEERLDKLGIPLGPRMRILQEAKVIGVGVESNYNVYIL